MQLLRVEEPENERAGLGGVWIGAHPTIGEKLAQARYLVITPIPHPTVGEKLEPYGPRPATLGTPACNPRPPACTPAAYGDAGPHRGGTTLTLTLTLTRASSRVVCCCRSWER
eukprot:scaffold124385_cov36-Phaeocystis_antarctica.AAC.1